MYFIEFFYNILPKPYFYLYLVVPLMVAFFYGLAWLFGKYRVESYCEPRDEKSLGVMVRAQETEVQPKTKQKAQVNPTPIKPSRNRKDRCSPGSPRRETDTETGQFQTTPT